MRRLCTGLQRRALFEWIIAISMGSRFLNRYQAMVQLQLAIHLLRHKIGSNHSCKGCESNGYCLNQEGNHVANNR